MAADAPRVDVMTAAAPIRGAERIFLSIFSCLHGAPCPACKHLDEAFGSRPNEKFSRDSGRRRSRTIAARLDLVPSFARWSKTAYRRIAISLYFFVRA